MLDIVDIRSAVKKGEIRFVARNGRLFCEGVKSGECVCVNDNFVIPDETWYEDKNNKSEVNWIIAMNKGEDRVYFKTIYAGSQGAFDGQIGVVNTVDKAARYTSLTMIQAQLESVKFSIKKNPELSNPVIVRVIKRE